MRKTRHKTRNETRGLKQNSAARPGQDRAQPRQQKPAREQHAPQDNEEQEVNVPLFWCKMLEFWRDCSTPRCKRERTCTGDMRTCSNNYWAALTEDEKVWVRTLVKARFEGHSHEEAVSMAATERQRYLTLMAIPMAGGHA